MKKSDSDNDIEYISDFSNDKTNLKHKEKKKSEVKQEPEKQEEKAQAEEHAEIEIGEQAAELSEAEQILKEKDLRIKQLEEEIAQLKDRYLRKLAEMDNMRKRLEKEKNDYYQYALSDLMLDLLDIVDNFERALSRPEEEINGKTFRDGVELIYKMLNNLLVKNGIQMIEIEDKKFDPNLQHATSIEEMEGIEEPEIAEVLQKGYLISNRLLRPAMVKVFVPKKN